MVGREVTEEEAMHKNDGRKRCEEIKDCIIRSFGQTCNSERKRMLILYMCRKGMGIG